MSPRDIRPMINGRRGDHLSVSVVATKELITRTLSLAAAVFEGFTWKQCFPYTSFTKSESSGSPVGSN